MNLIKLYQILSAFFAKTPEKLAEKLQIFQVITSMQVMTHLRKQSDIWKITTVLEKLISVKLLNLSNF